MWQFVRFLISKTRKSQVLGTVPRNADQNQNKCHADHMPRKLSSRHRSPRRASSLVNPLVIRGASCMSSPPGMLLGAKLLSKIQRAQIKREERPRNLSLPCSRPSSRLFWVCTYTGQGSPAWRKTQRSSIGKCSDSLPSTSSSGHTGAERSARRARQGLARVRQRREAASPAPRRGAGAASSAPQHFLKKTKRRRDRRRR